MIRQQYKLRFIDDVPPCVQERRWLTDPGNPDCFLKEWGGNEKVVKHLSNVAFNALARQDRNCSDGSFVVVGPLGNSIITVRALADLVKLPLIEIHSWVTSLNDLLVQIAKVLENVWFDDPILGRHSLELVPSGQADLEIELPPCIVLLNDFNSFPPHVACGIQAAANHPTRLMPTDRGWIVDTNSVCWAVAAEKVDKKLAGFVGVLSLFKSE